MTYRSEDFFRQHATEHEKSTDHWHHGAGRHVSFRTASRQAQPCPDDKVNRTFVAEMPNQLWVSDFTYVSSWQGMVYVAKPSD